MNNFQLVELENQHLKGITMGISNMIDIIRKRPGAYLGSNSITALMHFIDGYQFAERELAVCRKGELFPLPFPYMHEYAGYRLKSCYTVGWRDQILRFCNGDEEAAFWKFFEIYDEFNQVRMKRYWKAVLSGDNIAWNDQMEHAYAMRWLKVNGKYSNVKEPIYKDPLAVYVMELTISVYIFAVETANDIELERRFFMSLQKVKGNQPGGVERYFGPIDRWEEFNGSNISFHKKIVV